MKKLLIVIILFSACYAPKPTTTKKEVKKFSPVVFKVIDSVKGNQNQLYIKAYQWMANTFNSAKEVIQMQDKEAGKLIGKGIMKTPTAKDGLGSKIGDDIVYYTISIDVKDGKYRCVLSDFIHEGGTGVSVWAGHSMQSLITLGNLDNPPLNREKKRYDEVLGYVKSNSDIILASFKVAMNKVDDGF